MANPNLTNVSAIRGGTAYVIPSTTTATTSWTYDGTTSLTGLTPAANSIHRITGIIISNVTASAVVATVGIGNNPTFGSSTVVAYAAYQISVPPNAALIVCDKTTALYITENQSVGVTSGVASALTYLATFEILT